MTNKTYDNLIKNLPPYKLRSRQEMKELLHMGKVLARKAQIKAMIIDNEIPYYPMALPTYMHKERRTKMIKVLWMWLGLKVIQFRP